jgi:regulator of protease activity HflC (stomatin/prohibitin superfamily)
MKVIVEAYEKGLKFRNGRFVGVLEPGRYRVRRLFVEERVEKIDLRDRVLTVAGQEMMTADKVTLRLNVVATWRVVDPAVAVLRNENHVAQLYTDVQLALREAVAARTLDELIAEKAVLGDRVLGALKLAAAGYGVEVLDAGVKDIVLPGDLKAQYARVIEARKQAEAAQILRREEVAATRSLANTAQLLEKNPTLLKLKVLESLEKIAGAGQSKIVLPADFLSDVKENKA